MSEERGTRNRTDRRVEDDSAEQEERYLDYDKDTVEHTKKILRTARQIQLRGQADEEDELAESMPMIRDLRSKSKNKPVKRLQRGPLRLSHCPGVSRASLRRSLRISRQTTDVDWEDDTADEICKTLPTLRGKAASQKRAAAKPKPIKALSLLSQKPGTQVTTPKVTQPFSRAPRPPLPPRPPPSPPLPPVVQKPAPKTMSKATPPPITQKQAPKATTMDQSPPPPKPARKEPQVSGNPAVNALVAVMRQTVDGRPTVKSPVPLTARKKEIQSGPETQVQVVVPSTSPEEAMAPLSPKQFLEGLDRQRREMSAQSKKQERASSLAAGEHGVPKRKESTQIEQKGSEHKKPKLSSASTPPSKPKKRWTALQSGIANDPEGDDLPASHTLFPAEDSEADEVEVATDKAWTRIPRNGTDVKLPILVQAEERWTPHDIIAQGHSGLILVYHLDENCSKYFPKAVKLNLQGSSSFARKLRKGLAIDPTDNPDAQTQQKADASFTLQNGVQSNLELTGSPHFVRAWGYNKRHTQDMLPMKYLPRGVLTRYKHSRKVQDKTDPSQAWRLLQCLAKALSVMAYGSEDPYYRVPGWYEIVLLDWTPDNVFVGSRKFATKYHTCGGKDRTCYKLGDFEQAVFVSPPGRERDSDRRKELKRPEICFKGSVKPPESQETIDLDQSKASLEERVDDPIAAHYNYKTNIYLVANMLSTLIGPFPEPRLLDEEEECLEADLTGLYEDSSKEPIRRIVPNVAMSQVRFNRVLEACSRDDPRQRPEIGWILSQAIIGLAEAGDTPEAEDVISDPEM